MPSRSVNASEATPAAPTHHAAVATTRAAVTATGAVAEFAPIRPALDELRNHRVGLLGGDRPGIDERLQILRAGRFPSRGHPPESAGVGFVGLLHETAAPTDVVSDAALDRPGTPKTSPAAVPARRPPASPMVRPRRLPDEPAVSMLSLLMVCFPSTVGRATGSPLTEPMVIALGEDHAGAM